MRILFLLLFLPICFAGPPDQLRIVPGAESEIALDVAKTGIMAGKKHHFVFTKYMGDVTGDLATPPTVKVNLRIESQSIVCQDDWVSEKDRQKILHYASGKDMLDVATFPELRYQSSSIRKEADHHFTMQGQLTIRDRARPVAVTLIESAEHRQWTGSATILLSDFGLKPPSAALGTIGTKDEMQLKFHLRVQ